MHIGELRRVYFFRQHQKFRRTRCPRKLRGPLNAFSTTDPTSKLPGRANLYQAVPGYLAGRLRETWDWRRGDAPEARAKLLSIRAGARGGVDMMLVSPYGEPHFLAFRDHGELDAAQQRAREACSRRGMYFCTPANFDEVLAALTRWKAVI